MSLLPPCLLYPVLPLKRQHLHLLDKVPPTHTARSLFHQMLLPTVPPSPPQATIPLLLPPPPIDIIPTGESRSEKSWPRVLGSITKDPGDLEQGPALPPPAPTLTFSLVSARAALEDVEVPWACFETG